MCVCVCACARARAFARARACARERTCERLCLYVDCPFIPTLVCILFVCLYVSARAPVSVCVCVCVGDRLR